jgi:hypothetical protein
MADIMDLFLLFAILRRGGGTRTELVWRERRGLGLFHGEGSKSEREEGLTDCYIMKERESRQVKYKGTGEQAS